MIIGGAQENTLFNCLDLVRDHGDDVCLLTGVETGPEGDLLGKGRAEGLQVKYEPNLIRAIHPWKDWQALKAIRVAIREFRPDVVHTHSAKGGLLGRRAAYWRRYQRLCIPCMARRFTPISHGQHGDCFKLVNAQRPSGVTS